MFIGCFTSQKIKYGAVHVERLAVLGLSTLKIMATHLRCALSHGLSYGKGDHSTASLSERAYRECVASFFVAIPAN